MDTPPAPDPDAGDGAPPDELAERVSVGLLDEADASALHAARDAARAAFVVDAVQAELPWASWPWQRCAARTERHERCDLRRHGVELDHALERGMDTPRWSTQWTDGAGLPAARELFSVGQRYAWWQEVPPGAHRDEPVLEVLMAQAIDDFAQACLDAGVAVGPASVRVVDQHAALFERNQVAVVVEAPIERVASWADPHRWGRRG